MVVQPHSPVLATFRIVVIAYKTSDPLYVRLEDGKDEGRQPEITYVVVHEVVRHQSCYQTIHLFNEEIHFSSVQVLPKQTGEKDNMK